SRTKAEEASSHDELVQPSWCPSVRGALGSEDTYSSELDHSRLHGQLSTAGLEDLEPPTNIHVKTDDELLTELSDQKKLMNCYTTQCPFSSDCTHIEYLFDKSIADIKQRTSMYKRKGQTQQWFYLREQMQQILNRSHKASQTFQKFGRNDYYFEDIEELITLSLGRKSYWQAELILEETASHLRDQPWNKEFIWYLDKLVELYIQSVDRAKSMLNKALKSEKDVEEVASSLILDCAARIDFDALSNRLINKHLISLGKSNLATALYCAVVHGACNLARLVLDKASLFSTRFLQALVNGKGDQHKIFRRRPPLHLAIGFGYIDMVMLLVTRGADVDAKSQDWYGMETVPLHVAVEEERLSIVIYLLSLHANIEARCDFNKTPLMKAASSQDPDIVRYLLERGARVDQTDHFGQTALHHATEGREPTVIRLITAFGADIMARDRNGQTALHLVVRVDDAKMIEGLNILLNNTVDVDAKHWGLETALHEASKWGTLSAAEHLISRGASISAVGEFGTPLHYATRAYSGIDKLPIIRTILQNGGDVNNRRSMDGKTSLHVAVRDYVRGNNSDLEVLHALCHYGADVTIRDDESKSALDYAKSNDVATAVLLQYLPVVPVPGQGQNDMLLF
ncbi:MAG: hypothetical protein Q9192_007129, partial [Flavoplaca navasiana]